jgi:hypothetical protein
MTVYTAHEPPHAGGDRVDRGEQVVFVADAFDWRAIGLAPFLLLGHRLWVGLAIYAAAVVALIALLWALGADAGWITLGLLAANVIVGFEIGELRRSALDAAGWTMAGTVSGRSLAESERRFFDDWLPRQPMIARQTSAELSPTGTAPQASADQGASQPVGSVRRWPWTRR